jgi:hypothetical protein
MMLKGTRGALPTILNWRLFFIALSMIAASILAVSGIGSKGTVKSTQNPVLSDRGRPYFVAGDDPLCFSTEVFRICDEHGVPPKLVYAIIQVESQGNPRAVSRKGAMGLMQLMPEMIKLYQLVDPFDPLENINAGVRHLKYLLTEFSGNLPLTLAAYNAGPRAVRKYQGVPPYPETKNYLRKVLKEYQREKSDGELLAPLRRARKDPGERIFEKKHLSPDAPPLYALLPIPLVPADDVALP